MYHKAVRRNVCLSPMLKCVPLPRWKWLNITNFASIATQLASHSHGTVTCSVINVMAPPLQSPSYIPANHSPLWQVSVQASTTTSDEPVKLEPWSHITHIPDRRKVQNVNAQVLMFFSQAVHHTYDERRGNIDISSKKGWKS